MNEGNLRSVGAGTRVLVDEPETGLSQSVDFSLEIVDLQADMVNTGAPLLNEFRDWAVRRRRFQKLNLCLTDVKRGQPDFLIADLFNFIGFPPQNQGENASGRAQVFDRDADVRH